MTEDQFRKLPLLLDGGDGSLWPVNDNDAHWDLCMALDGTARRRFVRVSDILAALGISPVDTPVEIQGDNACGVCDAEVS